jgi:hypothetical protein
MDQTDYRRAACRRRRGDGGYRVTEHAADDLRSVGENKKSWSDAPASLHYRAILR